MTTSVKTIKVEYVTCDLPSLPECVDPNAPIDFPSVTTHVAECPVIATFDDSYVVLFNGERLSVPRRKRQVYKGERDVPI